VEGIIERVINITEKDILEVFGDSGSGKTAFALEMLKEAISKKMKIVFIDTERNVLQKEIEAMGQADLKWIYAPSLEDMEKAIRGVIESRERYDVFIVDSIGLPILGWFAGLKLNEKGNALLKMQQLLYMIKDYAYKNGVAVLVTNQPESRWMKPEEHDLQPFGDKGQFFVKEIWKSYKRISNPTRTVCEFVAWRSRCWGKGRKILTLEIFEEDGVKEVIVKWEV